MRFTRCFILIYPVNFVNPVEICFAQKHGGHGETFPPPCPLRLRAKYVLNYGIHGIAGNTKISWQLVKTSNLTAEFVEQRRGFNRLNIL
jgi:hypothetical protein